MRRFFLCILLLSVVGCSSQTNISNQFAQIIYNIDLSNHEDDLFHVTVYTSNLTKENYTYNFAATAPGTYQKMDFGRYVKTFKAFDIDGNELATNKISMNKWEIENVFSLAELRYDIEDTFDSEIRKNNPYAMSGSGIDENFVVLNTFAVLGYFEGLQSYPSKLKLDYKSDWTLGTALQKSDDGYYYTETYDQLADSPILMGDLSTAFTHVGDIDVEIYVFSNDSLINADKILSIADEVLQSSKEFIGYAPVDHYAFLMCLLSWEYYQANGISGAGALEHSYSSLYVEPASEERLPQLRSTMAHEFMHILTPLNLSSEVIHTYNFEVPTASEHIWLYEGVTEWVSDIMQLRSGITTPEQYLTQFSEKINISDQYNPNISLSEMSLGVYTDSIKPQFINFYNRGAVTAALLDIRLLELSNGTRGLRELYLELLEKYGKDNPFPEDTFFDIIVEMTYPEIEDFINDYIRGTKPLPYIEQMTKIGYTYTDEKISDDKRPTFGANIYGNSDGELILIGVSEEAGEFGIMEEDVLIKVFGEDVSMQNSRKIAQRSHEMKVGDPYEMVVRRKEKEIVINGRMVERKVKHLFEEVENPTEEQLRFRKIWLKNLDRD